jgi:homocysteine S-methyltransferase
MKSIRSILQAKSPILFDGATGTELYKRGIFINRCFEEANISDPTMVRDLHREYAEAGAEVLTTNSWGAGYYKLKGHNLQGKLREINIAAARIAREVAGDRLHVAGSVGPLGKRMEPYGELSPDEVFKAFRDQIDALVEGGVDLILLETFADVGEAEQAIAAARSVKPDMPVFASMTIDLSGRLLTGMSVEDAFKRIAATKVDVLGLNCSVGPQPMLAAVKKIAGSFDIPLIIQPNAGLPKEVDGRMIYMSTPEYFAQYAKYFMQEGVEIVGGCCGTTPDHIKAMSRTLRQFRAMSIEMGESVKGESGITRSGTESAKTKISASSGAKAVEGALDPIPFADKSRWAAKLSRNEKVRSIELLPPAGIEPERLLENARLAKNAGINAINIPDGPRACSRMSTIVTAIMVEQQIGIETILHCTCRDRNLISMQSDMLGAHAIGLRNVLCITGDPPKMGDYPDATGVFDIDSIGLTKMVRLLNEGIDIGGRPMGSQTSLSCGVGVNPGKRGFDREMERFKRKIDAGAEWAMTQPVFDVGTMESFLDYIAKNGLRIPIIMGIWPLSGLKNATFMKNEVPGIEIPDSVMERMAKPETPQAARDEGVAIAAEMYTALEGSIQGVQLSAPFGRIDLALRVIGK